MSKKEDKVIICFDATELDNFETCEFKHHLFHHRRLVPKHTKGYLEEGSLLHNLLENYYIKKRDQGNVDQSGIEEIVEKGRIESLKYEIELVELGQIIFQFREYASFYEDENIIPIFVEQPFTYLLYEDDDIAIYISGKPDLIFRYGGSNQKIVMDHKKVSRESGISSMRNQFRLYATALETDTVIVNKIGFQKTKSRNERFLRTPFVYSQDILDEWKEETIQLARRMVLYEQMQYYPRNRSSCEKWDGCWYARYCTTRPKAREFLVGSEFVVGKQWDAGEKLETSNDNIQS